MTLFRYFASFVSLVGLCMLVFVLHDGMNGVLAGRFFPEIDHAPPHHWGGLLLALPVPLHVIFIGLIIQKRWLSPPWARFAWFGITASGVWLGISLLVKLFVLPIG